MGEDPVVKTSQPSISGPGSTMSGEDDCRTLSVVLWVYYHDLIIEILYMVLLPVVKLLRARCTPCLAVDLLADTQP